jgi:hypothetical protein
LRDGAGVKRSTAYNYMAVAKGWASVQHAGSIREALRLLKKKETALPVDLRDVPLPFDALCVNDTHVEMPIGECAKTHKM